MSEQFCRCKRCGTLAAVLHRGGGTLCCCDAPMESLASATASGAEEKHRPVVTVEGERVHVTVGETPHPMDEAHRIDWIALVSERGIQLARLHSGDAPQADFPLCAGDHVRAVYAFCNQHELWRN